MKNESPVIFSVALSLIPFVGAKTAKLLISYCGSAQDVLETSAAKLQKIPGIGKKITESINENKEHALKKASHQIELAQKSEVDVLLYTDERYPKRLLRHDDCPYLIYYKGNANLNAEKIIGIVGTRRATAYGNTITEQIIKDLTRYNPVIVSGLAYGIDIYAHRYSLQNNLQTIGIMANGLDKIYPAVHKKTAFEMVESGGLLTEEPFGTTPDAPRFPQRNRIIAGLSDALIVVEAASKGGALITAEIAHSYDTEVFAVPGNIDNPYSKGCNALIRKHKANIYTGIADLEYIMGWNDEVSNATPKRNVNLEDLQLSINEQLILSRLQEVGKAMPIDSLSIQTQLSLNALSSELLMMEMKGLVKSLPGSLYKINL